MHRVVHVQDVVLLEVEQKGFPRIRNSSWERAFSKVPVANHTEIGLFMKKKCLMCLLTQ